MCDGDSSCARGGCSAKHNNKLDPGGCWRKETILSAVTGGFAFESMWRDVNVNFMYEVHSSREGNVKKGDAMQSALNLKCFCLVNF